MPSRPAAFPSPPAVRVGDDAHAHAPAAALVLGLLLCGACRGSDAAPAMPPEIPVRVDIVLHPQIRLDHELDELSARVAASAVRWVRTNPGPRLPVDADHPLEVAIRVELTEDLGRLVIAERLRLRHDRRWPLEVDRRREVPVGPAGIDLGATLTGGVRAALGLMAEMVALFDLDGEVLRATVRRSETSDDLRALAVRVLQERRARDAVNDLLDAFPDAPPSLRLTIVDALATLAAPTDLQRLLDRVDGRRVDEISHALRAAAIIGGRDAREFAGWMAMGHPDERVRQTALEVYGQITEALPPEAVLQLGRADVR